MSKIRPMTTECIRHVSPAGIRGSKILCIPKPWLDDNLCSGDFVHMVTAGEILLVSSLGHETEAREIAKFAQLPTWKKRLIWAMLAEKESETESSIMQESIV